MAQLADGFLQSRRARAPGEVSGPVDTDALERQLAALCARGRAAHPQLTVDDVVVAAHLGRCDAPIDAPPADIHAEDLYVCAAALGGNQDAIRTLRENGRPVLAGYLRRIDPSPAFVDEVEDRLWDAVLVGTVDAAPKLISYAGRGPLAGWLGIVAQRIALSIRRHEASEQRAVDGAASEAQLVAADPELAFIKGHLRGPFQRAIARALEALDDRERMVYRMHIIDGVSLDRIGKTYGVSQSTISRWMAGARDSIAADAKRLLHEELRASPADYESMSRLLASQLDLSVSRLFRKSS